MVATRFAVAIHILLLLACGRRDGPATSQLIAVSVNTNPVVVRRITGRLARGGLVRVRRGPGGAQLARPAEEITLKDVWLAMNDGRIGPLLPLHACPNQACPVGASIHALLSQTFASVDWAIQDTLGKTTLASLMVPLEARGLKREAA